MIARHVEEFGTVHRLVFKEEAYQPHPIFLNVAQIWRYSVVCIAYPMKLLNLIRSFGKPAQPTIESYGQSSSGIDSEKIQAIMEWLFASLLSAG